MGLLSELRDGFSNYLNYGIIFPIHVITIDLLYFLQEIIKTIEMKKTGLTAKLLRAEKIITQSGPEYKTERRRTEQSKKYKLLVLWHIFD